MPEDAKNLAQDFADLAALQAALDSARDDARRSQLRVTDLENKQRIAALSELYRSHVPTYEDPEKVSRWLDQDVFNLVDMKPAATNAGAANSAESALSPAENETARKMGVASDDYAKYKGTIRLAR